MKKFFKSYWFILCMLIAIVAGCIVGAVWPGATALEPLGTVFINLMFCVVVPMVFCSIASAIANMSSAKRAGKLLGTTVVTFLVTAAIAAIIMYIIVRFLPIFTMEPEYEEGVGSTLGLHHLSLHLGSLDDGQCVARVDEVTFLDQECEDAPGHLARYTVFLDLHLALNLVGGAMQSQVADEGDNEDYSSESGDC